MQSRNKKQQIAHLTQHIEKLVEERGVVDDDLNEHLSHITKEHSSEISEQYPEGSFARDSHCKALSLTKLSSMKWDPVMIR